VSSFLALYQHMLFSAIYCGLIPNLMQISLKLTALREDYTVCHSVIAESENA